MSPAPDRGSGERSAPESRRLFVAIFPPEAVLAALDPLRNRLRAVAPELRWVPRENLHFTLRFFGDLDAEAAGRAAGVLDAVAARTRPFLLEVAGLGTFPGGTRPRVLWAGCRAGAPVLEALARTLDRGFQAVGLGAADKPFRAHLTLARWRPGGGDAHPSPKTTVGDPEWSATFTVAGVGLIESRLGPGGSRYATVHHASFAAG